MQPNFMMSLRVVTFSNLRFLTLGATAAENLNFFHGPVLSIDDFL